jgi:hypothetical protein
LHLSSWSMARAPSRKISLKRGRACIRWVSQLMVPGRREWDVQLVKAVLYPHDVQEVLKLRLSEMTPNDHVAWFYEKSGDLLYKECLSPGG